uniref:Uncharacterized protein n=2 Tax=Ditylenchus dipsaci TaxID=166011 RepID=A0A915ENK0_9BILA
MRGKKSIAGWGRLQLVDAAEENRRSQRRKSGYRSQLKLKENQRVKAAKKTTKEPSLRKSVSVQVDITSSKIAKLQEDKKVLLCRLVEPKKKKQCEDLASRGSYISHLRRTASLQQIDQYFFFSATNEVRLLVLGFADELKTESMMIGGSCYTWLSNIKEVLVKSCLRLQKTNNLNFGGPFDSKLFLYLVGDKGGKTTKIAVGIGNVQRANSPDSLLLQLKFYRLSIGAAEREVLCLYQRNTAGRSAISNSEKTLLHRQSLSIAKHPLVKIPIENVIPPSLYIIQGLCQNVLDWVEKREPSLKQAWYQSFTGNHCRKLLSGNGPKRIADVIAGNSKHAAVEKLLTVLGQAQRLAKAAFLNCAEVEQLSELTKSFFQCLRVSQVIFCLIQCDHSNRIPDVSVTSKAHLLCFHVLRFVRCHGL